MEVYVVIVNEDEIPTDLPPGKYQLELIDVEYINSDEFRYVEFTGDNS